MDKSADSEFPWIWDASPQVADEEGVAGELAHRREASRQLLIPLLVILHESQSHLVREHLDCGGLDCNPRCSIVIQAGGSSRAGALLQVDVTAAGGADRAVGGAGCIPQAGGDFAHPGLLAGAHHCAGDRALATGAEVLVAGRRAAGKDQ